MEIIKYGEEWCEKLSQEKFITLREKGTERSFSDVYCNLKKRISTFVHFTNCYCLIATHNLTQMQDTRVIIISALMDFQKKGTAGETKKV
ncbi:MAG: hypothetical protein AAF487_14485 [Bacteroidota bacterium]